MRKLPFIIALTAVSFISHANTLSFQQLANQYLADIASPPSGIGAREAGTTKEHQTASYISNTLSAMGYQVQEQAFTFDGNKQSKNIIVNSHANREKTIILAAHYDSTAADKGSLGATDNGAGLAAMLAVAKAIKAQQTLPYNVRFIAFGAEEQGLKGSKFYVKNLQSQPNEIAKISAMINFDTIAGGDFIYVHSAHSTPYQCAGTQASYSFDSKVREAVLTASHKILGEKKQYVIHPQYPGYPAGVTGSWSDHAPFACAGIPIAYIESTNFTINGKDGFDGYSQSSHSSLWDCYDKQKQTACDRDTETKWGNIWHTEYDNLATLAQLFPERVSGQLADNVQVMIELLTNADRYLASK